MGNAPANAEGCSPNLAQTCEQVAQPVADPSDTAERPLLVLGPPTNPPAAPGHIRLCPENLLDLGMDYFQYDAQNMCDIYLQMFEHMGLLDSSILSLEIATEFAHTVAGCYRDVPFHNFRHGFAVAHLLYAVCMKCQAVLDVLTRPDLLVLLVAGLVHDADNPGSNNAWEVATQSALAVKYNECAVLQQHAAAIGRQILEFRETDVFGCLAAKVQQECLRSFTRAILQTDMDRHVPIVAHLKGRKRQEKDVGKAFSRGFDDRCSLVGILLHGADIGYPLAPSFGVVRHWAQLAAQECWEQYQGEVAAGFPPTQKWAHINTPGGLYEAEMGFINFTVSPFWGALVEVFPELQTRGKVLDGGDHSRAEWAALIEEEDRKEELSILEHGRRRRE